MLGKFMNMLLGFAWWSEIDARGHSIFGNLMFVYSLASSFEDDHGFWMLTWSWGESCCWVYGSSWENCCCGTSSSPWSKPSSNTKPFQHNAKQQYMKANKEMKTSSRQIVKTNMLQFSKKKYRIIFQVINKVLDSKTIACFKSCNFVKSQMWWGCVNQCQKFHQARRWRFIFVMIIRQT